jgi:hypothetical protein
MSDRICPHHQVELVPHPEDGFKCPVPGCSHGVKERHLHDHMNFTERLGLQGNSANTIDGQPEHEFARSSGDGVPSTSSDVTRTESGSTVNLSFDNFGPYKANKEKDERDTVERIRARYNEDHATRFDGVESEPEQNHPVDVWLTEQGQQKFGCQVTRSDSRASTGKSLGAEGKHSETITGQEAWKIMADAIAGKRTKTGGTADLVLVLDGVIPSVNGLLEELMQQHAEAIANSPFAEIWYSGRGVGAVIKRLK